MIFKNNNQRPSGRFSYAQKQEAKLMSDKAKPKPVPTTTAIVHPPTLPRGKKGSKVTGVLR
ncbi:hypothetical protein SpAn4DRAFT_2553 [Sporomusa ovata]|uniref:Uncharacterized protein n=1 Tax=Sporomusa ovata TaxID=2378 RepID=A0A0U1L0Y2_9FIRM|nr:hypothetical protein SpAn4DRAFT_2553 [Sporomusa ovata]